MTQTSATFSVSDTELESLLTRYTRDITAQDKAGKFDPVTGRDPELDQMTLILMQRLRKNVLLLGPAGVGKTALFVGIAQLINANKMPPMLKDSRLIELEMSMISGGSQSRSDLEGRLMPIVKGVAERNGRRDKPPIIFCIDELHQLMIAFKASGFSGIADLMKPYLTMGDLYIIGATTREEYDEYIKIEPAIDRRFQKISLRVPDVEMTYGILLNLKRNFETHYGFKISDEACMKIVKLTDQFIRNRNNPDKSILCLDLACARAIKKGITDQLDVDSIRGAVASEAGVDVGAIR